MSKITKRLVLYFISVLLVFTLIVGMIFTKIYSDNVLETNRVILEENAVNISKALSEYLEDYRSSRSSRHMGKKSGLSSFIRIVDEITYGEVVLVDTDMSLIRSGMHNQNNIESSLPNEGIDLINESLNGKTAFSDGFDNKTNVMAISTPVFDQRGEVVAAVFVMSPINGTMDALSNALFSLLLAILVALSLSFVVAMILSRKFINPIKRMDDVTTQLIMEDYTVETNIEMDDEFGNLAKSIDTLSKRLYELKKQQEYLDQERNQFYVDVSHELRTPVTVLKGSLELLSTHDLEDQKRHEYYIQMEKETIYLQHMINDLLDFSKLSNPQFVMNKDLVNLSDVVLDALRSMRRVAHKKSIKINIINDNQFLDYHGNYEKLRQMIVIVLDNAIRFSFNEGIINVSLIKREGYAVLEVQDFGKGISKEDLPHIFERYYTKDSNNSGGTGVGLAIAKTIAEHHDIDVTVSSGEEGTVFKFMFKTN